MQNLENQKVEKPFNKQKGMIQGIPVLDRENNLKNLLTLTAKQTYALFVNKLKIQSKKILFSL